MGGSWIHEIQESLIFRELYPITKWGSPQIDNPFSELFKPLVEDNYSTPSEQSSSSMRKTSIFARKPHLYLNAYTCLFLCIHFPICMHTIFNLNAYKKSIIGFRKERALHTDYNTLIIKLKNDHFAGGKCSSKKQFSSKNQTSKASTQEKIFSHSPNFSQGLDK